MGSRYQAMWGGERSVRSATIRPLMPAVPQQRAARTTSRNPRRDAGEWVGMTLLGRDPDEGLDPERAAGRPGRSGPGGEVVSPAALRSGDDGRGQDESTPARHGWEGSGPHGGSPTGFRTVVADPSCGVTP